MPGGCRRRTTPRGPRHDIDRQDHRREPCVGARQAAVARDVHRAAARGIPHLVVNENMVAEAMAEVQEAGLSVRSRASSAFPSDDGCWPAEEGGDRRVVGDPERPMRGHARRRPMARCCAFAREEFAGLATMVGEKWVVTFSHCHSARPVRRSGRRSCRLWNAPSDSVQRCRGRAAVARHGADLGHGRGGRRRSLSRGHGPAGPEETLLASLEAGADDVVCADFWTLTEGNRSS